MATKNIVPRGDNEGKLGTPLKRWKEIHLTSGIYYSGEARIFFDSNSNAWKYNCGDGGGDFDIGSGGAYIIGDKTITTGDPYIDFDGVDVWRIQADAPGKVAQVIDLSSYPSVKECIIIGLSNTNYVTLSGENIVSPSNGNYTIKSGDVVKLLWNYDTGTFIELFSMTS